MNKLPAKNRKKICRYAAVCANALLLVLLTLLGNSFVTDKNETGTLMKRLDVARRIVSENLLGNEPLTPGRYAADFFPVNIGYDREMVTATDEFGIPVGQRPVVSRAALARFLQALDGVPYRSIIVDVQFYKSDAGEADSALFAAINTMPRVVVSANDDDDAEDTILPSRLASSEYNTSFSEGNFVKYRYHHGAVPDIALATYNLRNNGTVSLDGAFPTDRGRLASGTLALWMPYHVEAAYDADGEKTYYNLGADLLDVYTPAELAGLVKGKTVVIGDYSGGDDHDTYTGTVSGPVILINAVIALEQHRHLINWWWMAIFFAVYVLLTLMLVYDPARLLPRRLGKSKVWNFIVTAVSFGTVILALNVVMYLCTGVIYDLYLPTLWLTALYFIKDNLGAIRHRLLRAAVVIRRKFRKHKTRPHE